MTDTELLNQELNACGVAVRAGVITPQTDDEKYFRSRLGLPAMSSDASRAWSDDDGVRRPITLTAPGGNPPPVPIDTNGQDPDGN